MKSTYLYVGLVVLLIIGLIFIKGHSNKTTTAVASTPIDSFATCLANAGAKFYGAYWCPHCQAQKKLFQNSKKLPYIECSTPDGKSQTQICIDEKITGYPTWKFADGSVADGEQTFDALSKKTSCPVPTT